MASHDEEEVPLLAEDDAPPAVLPCKCMDEWLLYTEKTPFDPKLRAVLIELFNNNRAMRLKGPCPCFREFHSLRKVRRHHQDLAILAQSASSGYEDVSDDDEEEEDDDDDRVNMAPPPIQVCHCIRQWIHCALENETNREKRANLVLLAHENAPSKVKVDGPCDCFRMAYVIKMHNDAQLAKLMMRDVRRS